MEQESNKKKLKKLRTGIIGLDALFYGGIQLEQNFDNSDGLLIMARGEHGVNKIHLAMQMLEGLYISHLDTLDDSEKSKNNIDGFNPLSQRDNLRFSFPIRMYFLNETVKIVKEIFKEFSEKPVNKTASKKVRDEQKRLKILYDNCKKDEHYARLCAMKYIDIVFPYKKIESFGILKDGILNKKDLFDKKQDIINELSKKDNAKRVIDVFIRYSSRNGLSKNYSNPELLFISLNKDGELINKLYFDFYIQRLIRKIKTMQDDEQSGILLHNMLWYRDDSCVSQDSTLEKTKCQILSSYSFPYLSRLSGKFNKEEKQNSINKLKEDIKSGYIYYNERTHGLHLRHQTGAPDTGDMLLCKVYIPIESKVTIIGRDELNSGNRMADGLTSFLNMINILNHYLPENDSKKKVEFIMIDGLSCLTHDEIVQCPFNALSDILRKACAVGVVTADNKAPTSHIDIVIDMAIKEGTVTDQLYNVLRISKCLYQRNAYGWHSYKMRVAGIEVIPSLRYQTTMRYLMDDAVANALSPLNEDPYPFWLNESDCLYEDLNINKAIDNYCKCKKDHKCQIDYFSCKSALKGVLHPDSRSAMEQIIYDIIANSFKGHSFLFIDLNNNRTEFKHRFYDIIECIKDIADIHLFSFQPGYIHADEFLWAIDQQVQAISRTNKKEGSPDTHYERTHLIIGDLNYMSFAYPCLNKEGLVLPAIASYTKKHHMTNYVYASVPSGSNIKLLDKETEIIRQMWAVVGTDNMIEVAKSKTTKRKQKKY